MGRMFVIAKRLQTKGTNVTVPLLEFKNRVPNNRVRLPFRPATESGERRSQTRFLKFEMT